MPYADNEIIAGILSNDTQILKWVYQNWGGMLKHYVLKNSGNEDDAKDLVQITITKLWENLSQQKYDDRHNKLKSYFWQIGVNTWLYELRQRKRKLTILSDSPELGNTADDFDEEAGFWLVLRDERIAAVFNALDTLKAPCHQLLTRFYLANETLKDLAVEMNKNYDNLKKNLFDCRTKLRKAAEKHLKTTD